MVRYSGVGPKTSSHYPQPLNGRGGGVSPALMAQDGPHGPEREAQETAFLASFPGDLCSLELNPGTEISTDSH